MGVRRAWSDWLNAGFDPASTDPQLLRRARSVSAGVAAILLLGPPFALQYLRGGAVGLAAVVVAAWAICGGSVVLLRRERRVTTSGAITLACLTVVFLTVIVASGGFYDETFASLYMLPVAAFGWLGRRNGIRYTAALLAITSAFWWLEGSGALDDSQLWAAGAALAVQDSEALSLVNRLAGILGVGLLAGTLFSTHEHSEERLLHDRDSLKRAVEASRRAEGLAVREAEARARFAATLSHELRTPMTAAMASADLLLESGLDERQRQLAQAIVRSGQAMLGVVADVLDYSKLRAGVLPLDDREFDPREVLDDIGQILAPQAHAKGLELVLLPDEELPERLCGDAARLRQILLNLSSNALKFTEQGLIRVHAHYAAGQLHVRVQDSGVGMTPEELAHVFDPFAQAAPRPDARPAGTGLGLTIARHFALHMGGTLHASSELGQGCSFDLAVPLARVAIDTSPTRVELARGVLVVDDHPEAREALRALLASLGVRCQCASGEAEATAWLGEDCDFDRVLVDAGLPGGGARRVAALAGPERTLLLCSPGSPAEGETVPPSTHGPYLAKPVGREALRQALVHGQTGGARPERESGPSLVEPADNPYEESGPIPSPAARRAASAEETPYAAAFVRLRTHLPPEQDSVVTRQLLEGFLAQARARTQRIHGAVVRGHTEALWREARGLRGNLGVLGLSGECERCTELMGLNLPVDGPRALDCLAQVERCLRRLNESRTLRTPDDGQEVAS